MDTQIKKIPLSCFRLIKKPSMDDFEYISKWLKDAFDNKVLRGYALYNNLNWIRDAFETHTVFVLRYKGKAVAFLTFSPPYEDSIQIVFRMVCVKPDFLRMGLATYLHKSAIEHFQKRGCLVAELWNVCSESYKLGKSMGFIKKQEESNYVSMVKILIKTRKQNCRAKIKFVVWDNCCGKTDTKPIYSWSLNFQRDKKPIIHYIGNYNWTVGIVKEDSTVCSGTAKYFFPKIFPGSGKYIYISEEKSKMLLSLVEQLER